MSLTSYRAALPRGRCCPGWVVVRREGLSFLSRSGGDLLSHVLRRSTIGATALNGRVRDGIGCFARAMATRPGKKRSAFGGDLWVASEALSKLLLMEEAVVCLLPDRIKPIEPLVPVN